MIFWVNAPEVPDQSVTHAGRRRAGGLEMHGQQHANPGLSHFRHFPAIVGGYGCAKGDTTELQNAVANEARNLASRWLDNVGLTPSVLYLAWLRHRRPR